MGREIKERIERICEDKGWTLYRLSKESGVAMTVLYHLDKKEMGPTASILLKIADTLGVKVDDLLRD